MAGFGLAMLGLAVMLAVPPVSAQRVEGDRAAASGIYEAEVPVSGQGEAERNNGFSRALAQVLAKISGDRSATGRPGVGQELRRAKEYVSGYDYRQDESADATGATRFRTVLVVRFDRARVDGVIGALGLPVWPQPRPKPVLWLAIDDGKGPRLVGLAQNNAARSVLDRATERGYRLGLPSGSAAEQAAVSAIWRGDTGAIARLSARYSPPMQLIGKLYRKGAGWKADWVFVDSGRVLSKWSSENGDARRAMAGGADGAADALIRRYARGSGASGPAGTYRVLFTGIDSADDYIRLSAYLQEVSVVRRFRPVNAGPNGLVLELELISGLPGFRRMVDGRGVLIAGDSGTQTDEDGEDGQPRESTGMPTYDLR
ncbi:MAG: DUF2066 domain-containing protein [Lysobacteraceae bacterium]|nr:MAG: DUF2066 domain-containing protein [Xanthomonadaceae bacterium]